MSDRYTIPGTDITLPDQPLDREESRELTEDVLHGETVRGWTMPAGRHTAQVAIQLLDGRVVALHYEVPRVGADVVEDGEWTVVYDSDNDGRLDTDTLTDRVQTSLKAAAGSEPFSLLDDTWYRGAVIPRSQTTPDHADMEATDG